MARPVIRSADRATFSNRICTRGCHSGADRGLFLRFALLRVALSAKAVQEIVESYAKLQGRASRVNGSPFSKTFCGPLVKDTKLRPKRTNVNKREKSASYSI